MSTKAKVQRKGKRQAPISFRSLVVVSIILRRRERCTSNTIADECGLDARTIKRAIQMLRAHGWVITWSAKDGTYDLGAAPRII